MASRTTETAIREILTTNLTSPQVRAFIADANLWITEMLVDASFSDQRLEIIERYLACALCRLKDLGLKDATLGDISETYQADPEVTDYLLRAASFDTSGKIRLHFLAPKPVAAPTPLIRQLKFAFGTRFVDELPKDPLSQ